jgi:hypothetical protein
VKHRVVWHGSESETRALLRAVEHNRECEYGRRGERTTACAAHAMLVAEEEFVEFVA